MRRTITIAGLLILAGTIGTASVRNVQPIYFTEGQDIILPDGSAGWTVERMSVVWVDPTDRQDMARARQAAARALEATAPLTLSPEAQAKYANPCATETDALYSSGPKPIERRVAEPCAYGDPSCSWWKTLLCGPYAATCTCGDAATNCVRNTR